MFNFTNKTITRKFQFKVLIALYVLAFIWGIIFSQLGFFSMPTTSTPSHVSAFETDSKDKRDDFWKYPTTEYPDISSLSDEDYAKISLEVSIKNQELRILSDKNILGTMIISSGSDKEPTPLGDFLIQPERGESFFAPEFNQGATNWVSFHGNGEFLFHSIPTDVKGEYIAAEGLKLGKPVSHGCIRLSVADSEWIYNNIRVNTPVFIKK